MTPSWQLSFIPKPRHLRVLLGQCCFPPAANSPDGCEEPSEPAPPGMDSEATGSAAALWPHLAGWSCSSRLEVAIVTTGTVFSLRQHRGPRQGGIQGPRPQALHRDMELGSPARQPFFTHRRALPLLASLLGSPETWGHCKDRRFLGVGGGCGEGLLTPVFLVLSAQPGKRGRHAPVPLSLSRKGGRPAGRGAQGRARSPAS